VAREHALDGRFNLDYPPGRLLAVAMWVKVTRDRFPQASHWRDAYTHPMLWANTLATAVASLLAGLLVYHWVRRQDASARHGGWVMALLAGLLLWFNPAVLANAHAWPQWDVWIVPFFLLACLLASHQCWLWTGVAVATGAMFKGQLLIVAPFFVFWPLFQLQLHGVVRVLAGLAISLALIGSPWLLRDDRALLWSLNLIAGAGVSAAWLRYGLRPRSWIIFFSLTLILLIWPKLAWGWGRFAFAGTLLTVLLIGWPKLIGRGAPATLFIGVTALTLFLAGWIFDGDWAWVRIGFLYATDHYQAMVMGPVDNLARLLQDYYGLRLYSPVGSLSIAGKTITLQILLRVIFYVLLTLAAFAVAGGARHGRATALAAMIAPFALMFAFLPQMHERYFMYAAAVSSIGVGVSVGMTLMHGVTTMLASTMIVTCLLLQNTSFMPRVLRTMQEAQPGISWAVIGVALIYLSVALSKPTPTRKLHSPSAE